jgi:hypothetical protein
MIDANMILASSKIESQNLTQHSVYSNVYTVKPTAGGGGDAFKTLEL